MLGVIVAVLSCQAGRFTHMDKTNFDQLIERYLKGEVTDLERNKIEAWLDANKARNGKSFVGSKQDEEELFRKITSNINNTSEILAYEPGRAKVKPLISRRWLELAATVLLLATVTAVLLIWYNSKSNGRFEYATNAENEKRILADGTI